MTQTLYPTQTAGIIDLKSVMSKPVLTIYPRHILDDPVELQATLPPEVLELNDFAARAKAPVQVELTVQRDGESLIVTGHLETVLSVLCCRCGDWIDRPVKVDNFVQLLEAEEIAKVDSIDLTPLVREDILLDLPVAASCRLTADWKCPFTGKAYPEPKAGESPSPIHGEDIWKELEKIKEEKD